MRVEAGGPSRERKHGGLSIVKVRRSSNHSDLRKLPLDGSDMFLLSCIEGDLTVAQLADITGASARDTERRLLGLARMGLVEGVGGELKKQVSRTRKLTRPGSKSQRVGGEATMRPPPPTDEDLESIETLRPLSKAPEDLERITPLRPPSLEALFQAEPTGALLKLLTPGRGHPLEEVKIPRKRRTAEL